MSGNDTLILAVGTFVTFLAVWAAVVYFLLLYRERFEDVDQSKVEIVRSAETRPPGPSPERNG